MKKLLSLIICLLCALNLCADVVLTIKGKGKQRSLKRESQSGPAANIGVFKKNLEKYQLGLIMMILYWKS